MSSDALWVAPLADLFVSICTISRNNKQYIYTRTTNTSSAPLSSTNQPWPAQTNQWQRGWCRWSAP